MLLSLHHFRHSRGLRILALFACLLLVLVSTSSMASGWAIAETSHATCQDMMHVQGHATDMSCMDNHAGTPHGDCHCPPMSGSLLPCPDVASAAGRREGLLYGPAMVVDAPSPAFLPPLRPPSV